MGELNQISIITYAIIALCNVVTGFSLGTVAVVRFVRSNQADVLLTQRRLRLGVAKGQNHRGCVAWTFFVVLPAALFAFLSFSATGADAMSRNLTLGAMGAVMGAAAFIWAGYFFVPTRPPASAQSEQPIASVAPHDNTFVGTAPPGLAAGRNNTAANDAGQTPVRKPKE